MLLEVKSGELIAGGKRYRCAVGKGGVIAAEAKREGDGCTPAGTWPLRELWVRADRLEVPKTALPVRITQRDDGWCDDPASLLYNTHFKITVDAPRHENLWREDHVYDLIIPLGYNDAPPVAGKGSAIFMHLAHGDYRPTEGCIALAAEDMQSLLPQLTAESRLTVHLNA